MAQAAANRVFAFVLTVIGALALLAPCEASHIRYGSVSWRLKKTATGEIVPSAEAKAEVAATGANDTEAGLPQPRVAVPGQK